MKNRRRKIYGLEVEKRSDTRTKKRGNIPQHFVLPLCLDEKENLDDILYTKEITDRRRREICSYLNNKKKL